MRPTIAVLLATLLTATAPASIVPYHRLLDAQGKAIDNDDLAGVVQNRESLEALYADHARGDPRAKEVVKAVEVRFAYLGRLAADRASSPACLVAPEAARGCRPRLPILDPLKDSPPAARLRDVTFTAFEQRLEELKGQRLLTEAGFNLLMAGMVWGRR